MDDSEGPQGVAMYPGPKGFQVVEIRACPVCEEDFYLQPLDYIEWLGATEYQCEICDNLFGVTEEASNG